MKDFVKFIVSTAIAVVSFACVLLTFSGFYIYACTRNILESSHYRR